MTASRVDPGVGEHEGQTGCCCRAEISSDGMGICRGAEVVARPRSSLMLAQWEAGASMRKKWCHLTVEAEVSRVSRCGGHKEGESTG